MDELSTRFVKFSLCGIDSTSADYKEKIFEKFISLNQKSFSQNQFLMILNNETLSKVLQSVNICSVSSLSVCSDLFQIILKRSSFFVFLFRFSSLLVPFRSLHFKLRFKYSVYYFRLRVSSFPIIIKQNSISYSHLMHV